MPLRGPGLISHGLYVWPPLPPLRDPLPERLRFCFTEVLHRVQRPQNQKVRRIVDIEEVFMKLPVGLRLLPVIEARDAHEAQHHAEHLRHALEHPLRKAGHHDEVRDTLQHPTPLLRRIDIKALRRRMECRTQEQHERHRQEIPVREEAREEQQYIQKFLQPPVAHMVIHIQHAEADEQREKHIPEETADRQAERQLRQQRKEQQTLRISPYIMRVEVALDEEVKHHRPRKCPDAEKEPVEQRLRLQKYICDMIQRHRHDRQIFDGITRHEPHACSIFIHILHLQKIIQRTIILPQSLENAAFFLVCF